MTSPLRYRAADTDRLSELRSDRWPPGARLLRRIVRSAPPERIDTQARRAFGELLGRVEALARDDGLADGWRGKAAEFLVRLADRTPRDVAEAVDLAAEAAAASRLRSGALVDFLSVWCFVLGERHVAGMPDPDVRLPLEEAHLRLWGRFRRGLFEVLEAGRERLRAGRRFRLSETYLARFRLMRARLEAAPAAGTSGPSASGEHSSEAVVYGAQIVADLFVLSLGPVRRRLVVSQLPTPTTARRRGSEDGVLARLVAQLRSVCPEQPRLRWRRIGEAFDFSPEQAEAEFVGALAAHLRRCWTWLFPSQPPFGAVREALDALDEARLERLSPAGAERRTARLLALYLEALAFLLHLLNEDLGCDSLRLDEETEGGGVFP